MNYTNNYHLPQWDKADRVLMNDFNQMCLDLEAGLLKTAQDAASSTAKAQSTADSALARAKTAQSTADHAYSPSRKPYTVGTYTGNGGTLQVSFGFRPSFVIVSAQRPFTTSNITTNATIGVSVAGPSGNLSPLLVFTDSGMTVTYDLSQHPTVNLSGAVYNYIAFR